MGRINKYIIIVLLISIALTFVIGGCTNKDKESIQPAATEKENSAELDENKGEEKGQEDTKSKELSREETVTFTYLYPLGSGFQVVDTMNDNIAIQKSCEARNVKIKFIHPPQGQEYEQFNLILSSDELPDIITHGWGIPSTPPGGPEKAIAEGLYIALNDLIKNYAPNFLKIITEDDKVRKDCTTDKGDIWGMPMVDRYPQPPWQGPAIRKDYLDKINMEIPRTIEEWYLVLKALKENAEQFPNMEAPFLLDSMGRGYFHEFIGAYGVTNDFINVDGKVKYGPLEEGFKEYLKEMNKWYKEGLIHKDFAAGLDKVAYLTTGKVAAADDVGFWQFDSFKAAAKEEGFNLVAAPYPSLKKGEKVHLTCPYRRVGMGYHTSITTACKNPERAVDWLDWFYSEEGSEIANWGIEGEHWKLVNGEKRYTEKVYNNPEGVTMNIAYFKYSYSHGAFLREWDRECQLYSKEANGAMELWHESADDAYLIPTFISMTPEESNEFSSIMSDINTHVSEMMIKFIMGEESFDNYDNFVNTIKSRNIDRAIEIMQAALDRYNKR